MEVVRLFMEVRILLLLVSCCCRLFVSCGAELILTAQPVPTPVILGQDLLLDCLAQDVGFNRELSYSWQFQGLPVSQTLPQASFFPNHSLFLPTVGADVLGDYQCSVWPTTGPHELVTSDLVAVLETYLQEFFIHPETQTIYETNVTTLSCVTGRGAPPPSLSWEKDGRVFRGGVQEFGVFGTTGLGGAKQQSATLELVASPQTEGRYKCVAVNPLSGDVVKSDAASLQIKVESSAPFISSDVPAALMMTASAPYSITCPILGEPQPSITWFKDGATLEETWGVSVDAGDGSLSFHSVWKEDAGMYFCAGSNDLGSVETPGIDVTVAYLDVFFLAQPDSTTAIAGQELTLTCDPPHSHPPAKVLWYKDDRLFAGRTGELAVSTRATGDLFFRSVQLADIGEYFCVALNEHAGPKSVRSEAAVLTVYGSPVLLEPAVPTKIIKGHTLYLSCVVDANPTADTSWLKDGLPLKPSNRLQLWKSNQDLTITEVTKSDEGSYRCRAVNEYGMVESADVAVTVTVPPEITLSVPDLTVAEGAQAFLPCEVYGDPAPTVTWLRGEEEMTPGLRVHVQPDGLHIEDVQKSDEGAYTCRAENEGGIRESRGTLWVQVAPRIVSYPSDKVVNQSQAVVLYCDATGDPSPVMSWKFNGTADLPAETKVTEDGNTLIMSSAEVYHSGTYTCTASSDAGSAQRSVAVYVQVKPQITSIEGNILINQGDNLDLVCEVTGIPQPSISWRFIGRLLEPSSDIRVLFPEVDSLRVQFVTGADSGRYTCLAVNAAGVEVRDVLVQVRETPSPPLLHTVHAVSTTSVNLSWTPASQQPNTEVDSFTIQYKNSHQADFQTYRGDISSLSTWHEVGGLQPAAEYTFKMAARNDIGTGRFGAVLGVMTLETAPSPVRNLRLLHSGATSIRTQWEVPAQPNGRIRIYQLWYRARFEHSDFTKVDLNTPTLPLQVYTLEGLTPYTTYSLRVRAANIEGGAVLWGDFSVELSVTTAAAVPSASPPDVHLSVMSSSAIHVEWKSLDEAELHGELQGYHVLYRESSTHAGEFLIPIDTVTMATDITGLLPWRYYEVQVAAFNDIGRGPRSPSQRVRTNAEVPTGSPTAVHAQVLSPTSVQVTWQPVPVTQRNSEISGYIVRYKAETEDFDRSLYVGNPNTLHAEISGLTPWMQYEVQVQAFTTQVREGFSPLSAVHTVHTLEAVPGPVKGMESTTSGTHSITVTWDIPADPNGIIQSYTILHQAVGGAVTMETTQTAGQDSRLRSDTREASDALYADSRLLTVIVSADETSHTLRGLQSATVYYVGIAARTSAGLGPLVNITAITDAIVAMPTTMTPALTTVAVFDASTVTEVTEQTELTPALQGDGEGDRGLSPEALVGVVVGATLVGLLILAFVILAVVVCCRKHKQKKTSSNYIPNSSYTIGTSPADRGAPYPPATDAGHSTDSYVISTNQLAGSSGVHDPSHRVNVGAHGAPAHGAHVGAHGATPNEPRSTSSTNATYDGSRSERGVAGHGGGDRYVAPHAGPYVQNIRGESQVAQAPPSQAPPSLQRLFPPQAGRGLDNPAFEDEGPEAAWSRTETARQSVSSLPAVHRSSRDLYSQVPVSKRRQNRMQSAAAAAIAAQRNVSTSVFDDTESLIRNDSVVVYDERTAL